MAAELPSSGTSVNDGSLLSENSDGTKDEGFSQHQFGGSFGGPIKRDRTFFFFSYDQNEEQRFRAHGATRVRMNVPGPKGPVGDQGKAAIDPPRAMERLMIENEAVIAA